MNFYSHSKHLVQHQKEIEQHWQSCRQGYFSAKSGKLFYAYHVPQAAKYSIVLINGRIESVWKYQELLWELAKNNIAVFSYDHIGQGLSPRTLTNPHIGHVHRFNDYTDDLHCFMQNIVEPNAVGTTFMLAHSMGAAISYDYLANYPHAVSGAFLSAPMFDIQTHDVPYWLAKIIARLGSMLGFAKLYAFGQGDYEPPEFWDNKLTQCATRYQRFRTLYQNEAELRLGGVSFNWLSETFNIITKLPTFTPNIPIHIASAENDLIVNNQAQTDMAKLHHNISISHYANARHELLCEIDDTRHAVLSQMYHFYDALAFTAKETGS
ncbi:alpha/beta hydrolase [Pseudoalteromonas citrea]|uniref:Alpha/beta hydrolase n=1 Tax=Pseudoalteromonas citrea TaxID=43655 RepID=A0A5S3XQK4_9GAMM|nr:alpha/beta fold hydrolase [Pseudoalteromonas citrea]TMP43576.1 alpha/beta hydrolase [Pseudoalteromonas citrea]TMP59829.1 alpha/beta hydrolase [Pseudoalteromonas citrea]